MEKKSYSLWIWMSILVYLCSEKDLFEQKDTPLSSLFLQACVLLIFVISKLHSFQYSNGRTDIGASGSERATATTAQYLGIFVNLICGLKSLRFFL